MSSKRCYKQYCGMAKALDVIGERWTLLILRDLMLGPWRYSDLHERMTGITTNLLANRLKDMEKNGLIKKSQLSSLGSPHVYELTELGKQLEPTMLALSQFGANFMHDGPGTDEKVDAGHALLNLKSRYHGKQKGLLTFILNNNIDQGSQHHYQVNFSAQSVDIHHGENFLAQTKIELSLKTYADMAFSGNDATILEKAGKIKITGNKFMWKRFMDSFSFHYS